MSDIWKKISSLGAGDTLNLTRTGIASLARLAVRMQEEGRFIALVVPSREDASLLRAYMTLFSPELSTEQDIKQAEKPFYTLPFAFLSSFSRRSLSREGWAERNSVLFSLRQGHCKGIILTADNLIARFPPLDYFEKRTLFLNVKDEISPETLLDQLIQWGYQREPMVSHSGDMARRGDIFDVLPPGYIKPIRLDFFGDYIDEMRSFDSNTQRSIEMDPGSDICLLPVSPMGFDVASQSDIQKHLRKLFQHGSLSEFAYDGLLRAVEQTDIRLLPGMIYENPTCIEDWLPEDTLWFLPGNMDLKENLEEAEQKWHTALEEDAQESHLHQYPALALRSADKAVRFLESYTRIYAEPLLMGVDAKGFDLREKTFRTFEELFPAEQIQDRPWQQFVTGIQTWLSSKRQVILSFVSDRGRAKFLKLAEQDGLKPLLRYDPKGKGLFALIAPLYQGADLLWDDCLILGEEIIQPRSQRTKQASKKAFRGMDSYEGLKTGDLLVHRDYGVGRFAGLHRMQIGGVENDYLLLEYADKTKLHLPVDRLSVIQQYKVGEGAAPALDKLGSSAWASSKEKASKAIERIAADLVEMYAYRKVAKGFMYSPLGEMYYEFAASFGFEETPDQAKAIQDVLLDMEKPEPMDRLVCGDVGFGKTEVALRAAFRAACDGKQTALLCPTTILAEQHFQTFRSRLAGFPINVGLLNRFVSKAKQIETLKQVALGEIDILIGTHRLLSSDVSLPNLGLLILDEEQRFGVRHKEKLKQLKKNVDALTLTATPIPRTLQLSISGIRDLSIIESAPLDRKPVATAIMNKDKGALRQILERELEREGQVFWVYNRVNGLEKVAAFVRELVPNARVGMAHGQMPEKLLEKTMHEFWHGELDVLVCTAIIESGLDFPRANTIIVDQAQMFGLGQLYQIRGRVGRSDRQAYAFFILSDLDTVPKSVTERMRIILELDYLGAGLQIAMEDLRLRGAGNILGEAQSGHMTRVGLDLYLEMLEDAVARLKGTEGYMRSDAEVNLALPAFIPETYMDESRERLKYYKMLSSALDASAREKVELEIRDRFGQAPVELETFFEVLNIKEIINAMGISRADIHLDRMKVVFMDGQTKIHPDRILSFALANQEQVKMHPPQSLELRLSSSQKELNNPAERIRKLKELLVSIKP